MRSDTCVFTLLLICGTTSGPMAAQDAGQSTPAAQAPAAAPVWSAGPIKFSGLVDGYYSLNFNHPASGTNLYRNFDAMANQFSLNMARLTLEHDPDPVGFKLDLGFGKAYKLFHATEPGGDVLDWVPQAYVSLKPKQFKGTQFDFGKFYTSAGAELTETHLNWNYSRSFIYALGPYYHMGVRVTQPLNDNFTVGVQLINGWNNVQDNNSGKTVGLTTAFTSSKVSWFNNYYTGPEKTGTNEGKRNFYDTVVLLTPAEKTSLYVNFNYGAEKYIGGGSQDWIALAGAARFQVTDRIAFSPRLEYYYDKEGWATGQRQKLKEFTFTAEYKMVEGLHARAEYRRDWSDQPVFERGMGGLWRNQTTLLVGVLAFFGPAR